MTIAPGSPPTQRNRVAACRYYYCYKSTDYYYIFIMHKMQHKNIHHIRTANKYKQTIPSSKIEASQECYKGTLHSKSQKHIDKIRKADMPYNKFAYHLAQTVADPRAAARVVLESEEFRTATQPSTERRRPNSCFQPRLSPTSADTLRQFQHGEIWPITAIQLDKHFTIFLSQIAEKTLDDILLNF